MLFANVLPQLKKCVARKETVIMRLVSASSLADDLKRRLTETDFTIDDDLDAILRRLVNTITVLGQKYPAGTKFKDHRSRRIFLPCI